MSKEPEMTAAEEVATREWANDDAMPPVNTSWKADVRRCLASLDASRAREAKLVEALREALGLIREAHEPPSRDMSLSAEWDVIVALRLPRLDALLPTSDMPSNTQGE
jgi:hypothetical protein